VINALLIRQTGSGTSVCVHVSKQKADTLKHRLHQWFSLDCCLESCFTYWIIFRLYHHLCWLLL